jgi:hypothetical protein
MSKIDMVSPELPWGVSWVFPVVSNANKNAPVFTRLLAITCTAPTLTVIKQAAFQFFHYLSSQWA